MQAPAELLNAPLTLLGLLATLPQPVIAAALATGVVLLCSFGGPLLERIVFEFVARRIWIAALSRDTKPAWALSIPTALDRVLRVVASGPFKAPFAASIVLLSLSGRVSANTACFALFLLYAMRLASTGQPHVEEPLVARWRAQHGGASASPKVWPRASLQTLARGSLASVGPFETEDLRAYVAFACVLKMQETLASAAMRFQSDASLTAGVLTILCVLLPVWMLLDAWLELSPRVNFQGRDQFPEAKQASIARRAVVSFACALAYSHPSVRLWPVSPEAVVACGIVLIVATQLVSCLGFFLEPDPRVLEPDAVMAGMLVSPSLVRKTMFQRDLGVSGPGGGDLPLLRWVRLRARVETLGLATAMRASSRLDLLLTGLLASGLFL